ncbi:hypothetical protein C8F04DRAFT_55029 [Mycena alexandri]|uniref:Uncharacterized protein n=1 Tax=Mycena alexandri TaxID=1745969 RepID=A0AAD6TEF7_9AGAR|nr:hypothetical protein C8F04DRAFT_55029 [Mycena alexandri]
MQQTPAADSLGAALGFIFQPLLHCFGLSRPHGDPDHQEAILDTVPPLRSPEFSVTRFLTSTYVARTMRPLICLPGMPTSSPCASPIFFELFAFPAVKHFPSPSSSGEDEIVRRRPIVHAGRYGRHLSPLGDASPKSFNEAGGAYCSLVSASLDHILPPLDLCGHCHTEKGCSLGSHSLSPCQCLNDHRFEQQRTPGAWHSLWCSKCEQYCHSCPGPSSLSDF